MANFNLSETIFGSDSEMAMFMRSRFAPAESNANELKIQTQTPLGSIETWFKKPVSAFTHQHVRGVWGESAYRSVFPYMQQVLAGQRVSYESQIPYERGGTRYLWADYIPYINAQSEVEGYCCLVSDISDRKQTENERQRAEKVQRESETNFHAMFSLTSIGIAQIDTKTRRFLRVNAAFCEITGYTEAGLLALTVDDVNHPDDRDRDRESFIMLHGGK
jgi:PAS domain-containing protein